jgi:hypothetical protein
VAYEKFISKSVRRSGPFISMRPDGRIRFNVDATRRWLNHGISRVELLWDKGNGHLAFRAAPDHDHLAYKLSVSKEQNFADVGVKAFMRHIGFPSAKKTDVPLQWNEAERMFEAKIPHEFRAKGAPRRRRDGMP